MKISGGRDSPDEILLQEFVRMASKHESIIADRDGQQGMFFQKVGGAGKAKQPVWWIPPQTRVKSWLSTISRASAEAVKEKVSLAFRVGGAAFLGLSLAPDKNPCVGFGRAQDVVCAGRA